MNLIVSHTHDRRALIFTFPYNVIHLFFKLFVALCLSVMCGIIYWHVRVGREQEFIWDRIGFYHAILTIFTIPLLLIELNDGKSLINYASNNYNDSYIKNRIKVH